MKLARLDTLQRDDSAFQGGEPDAHYELRQIIVVEDSYDFGANSATDISSLQNWDKWWKIKNVSCTNAKSYITALFTNPFNTYSSDDQVVISKWFLVEQVDRDTVLSRSEQDRYAEELADCLVDEANNSDQKKSLLVESFTTGTVSDAENTLESTQSASVLGSNYKYAFEDTPDSTTGVALIYLTLETDDIPAGDYKIEVDWCCQNTSTGGDWYVDITEGSNSVGNNTSLIPDPFKEEGIDSGSDQRWPRSTSFDVTFTEGVKNINIEIDQFGSGTFSMFWAGIRFYRVG